jgi:hypothetical protein
VVVHHHLALHGFWLLVWLLKSLRNFVKRFEGFWFEFKKKSLISKEFEKEKNEKKRKSIPFGPAGLLAHHLFPAAAHLPAPPFLFPPTIDTPALPVSLSPPPSFLLPLPCSARPGAAAIPPRPATSPSFPPHRAGQLRKLTSLVIN